MKKLLTLLIALCTLITSNTFAQPTDCQSDRYQQQVFNNIRVTEDITYGSAQNVLGFTQSLELDFYEPDPAEEYLGKRPLVVMFFGGAYILGSKGDADMVAWCDSLAHYGYACASVEYRLDNAPNFALPGRGVRAAYRAIQDGRAAIRYLLEDPNGFGFNVDPDRIYTGGESAGAITAIHIAYMEESERPADTYSGFLLSDQGCIDCSGNSYVQPFTIAGIIDLWGATLDLDYLDAAENVPMVIIHGEDDFLVPYTSGAPFNVPLFPTMYGAVPMDAELTAKGICHQFFSYPGEGHVFYGIPSGVVTFPNQYWEPVFTQGHEFLYGKTMQFDSPVPAGETMICQDAIETYEVPATAGSIYCWDVVNGTIISTNNNQVTVQWGSSPGFLTLTETTCIDVVGTPQTIEVLPFNCCAPVDLTIQFDGFPSQTSWEILDSGGNVVASGGTYAGMPGNSSVTESTCLLDGCYTLNFYDAIGNGMCPFQSAATSAGTFVTPGTLITPGSVVATLGSVVAPGLCGNYALSDVTGTLTIGGGGFGSSQSNTFCVSGITPFTQDNQTAYFKTHQTNSPQLSIQPNIVKDRAILYYSFDNESDIQINVVNMSGQIVQQYIRTANDAPQLTLDISDLHQGIYFVQCIGKENIITKKIIKK